MKKFVKLMLCIMFLSVLLAAPQSVSAKSIKGINIKKTFGNCRYWLEGRNCDKNKDGYLSKKEVKNIKCLKIYSLDKINLKNIKKLKYLEKIDIVAEDLYNMKEIKKLQRLKKVKLDVESNKRRVLDLRKSKNIKNLNIFMYNSVVKINKKNKIEYIRLTGIENCISLVNKCYQVKKIWLNEDCKEESLIINNRKKLSEIHLRGGVKVNNLEIKECNKLKKINIAGGKINECIIEDNDVVKSISIVAVKRFSKMVIKNSPKLTKVYLNENPKMKSLTLDNLPNLQEVICTWGALSELNIIGKNDIRKLWLWHNKLTKFEYTNLSRLISLDISNNQIEGRFDMTLYPCLGSFDCSYNRLTEIYGGTIDEAISYINCNNNQLKLIDFRGMKNGYILGLDCKNNPNVEIYGVVEDGSWDASAKYYCTV